ncbi:helix-turn-helix domain-containing protein, partial [Sphingomonas sp.]|uniref:AraC family transcriptional regulator n=1 Tax=Sphingomonas sp. TaxID=28214 RepID=UPI003D6D02AF
CALSYLVAARWAPGAQFWIALVQHGLSLILIVHAIMIAFLERGDDLIEKRRRLRFGFVVLVGSIAFIVLVLEMLSGFRYSGLGIALGQSIAILIATTAVAVAFLQSDPELLFDPAEPAPEPKLSPSEHVLKRKLDAAIAGAVHREPGLSIGGLAERLGTPEHRLRSLINQRLGYRNFSAFLNHHRIAEAKALLADPAHVDLPILTIAMDLGYGSLAPFNRAFRQETGQAPSNFRRAAIVDN